MKKIVTSIISLFILSATFGQLVTPFTIRYQTQQKGGITFISNSAVTCDGGVGCGAGQAEIPPVGSATNNGFIADYIDIDSDTNTYMSSSDSLNLPACSQVTWAGLYWGGENQSEDSSYANRDKVKIKTNNGSYVTLTADYLEDNVAGFSTYHCFKDITSIIQANGLNARYTLADVAARVGGTNRFGGWTIVVVYKNDLMSMRNLTVFNGLSNVSTTNPITDIPISGFLTPLAGPVSFELGMVVYDGDRSSTGDQLQFNGNGSFVNISDALNPATDIFNSTIGINGVLTSYRNPNMGNTLGFDADIFYPNNLTYAYIGNNDTSAVIRQTTGGETFLTQVVTSAIDIYEPDLRAEVSVIDINGGTVIPGDTLEYTVVTKNIGSDPSLNSYFVDTLEHNVEFVPGSMNVTWGPNPGAKTDIAGDDQGEYIAASRTIKFRVGSGASSSLGGIILNSPSGADSTRVIFRVVASSNCVTLGCDNMIDNLAYIHGTGNASGNTWYNESTPGALDSMGCSIVGATSSLIISTTCVAPSDTSISPCMHGSFTSAYNLPGYTYYNDSYNAVTTTDTVGTFYAINSTYSGCGDTVVITIASLMNCDIDNDSLLNDVDMDDDNDGLLDTLETGIDTDGDGLGNFLDLDSDNDGIPDIIEAGGIDTNANGMIDVFIDLNGDGMDDTVANNPWVNADSDGDGVLNMLDLDSDDDGIADVIEANGADPDSNGQISTGAGSSISDIDGDGLANAVDPDYGSTPLVISNTDTTGGQNYVDIDSDGDGIVDNIEAQLTASYQAPANADSDGDGLDDMYDNFSGFGGIGIIPVNTDSAGYYDYADFDTDNDGDLDLLEGWDTDNNGIANVNPSWNDNDNDGLDDAFDNNDTAWISTNGQIPTFFPNFDVSSTLERDWREMIDYDNDGTTDINDLDNDNDGIPDSTEIATSNGGDTDNDGNNDEMDLDTDNDGITDIIEAGGIDANGDGKVDGFVDANNDGLDDNLAINPLPGGDFDADPLWNGADLDSDNDGITDVREANGSDPDNNGQIGTGTGATIADTDNDGLANIVDPDNGGTPLNLPNTDANGKPNYIDLDSDGDGIVDNIEAQSTVSYIAPIPSGNDSDDDGIIDTYDNIVGYGAIGLVPVNTDGTTNADYMDTDADDDTQSDALEGWDTDNNGTANTNPSNIDSDSDGLDNAYDNDDSLPISDNDQTPMSFPNLDNTSTAERDWREAAGAGVDSDNDGVPDITDVDDDNDGLLDVTEQATAHNSGNTDLDSQFDILDLDSDNDGIKDVIEAGGNDPDHDGIIGTGAIVDTDGDGWSNITDSDNGGTALPNPDTDSDGTPNFQDLDSDDDEVTDNIENDPFGTGNGPVDTDGDGIPNYIDNNDDDDIRLTMNEADEDGDGILDDCDNDAIPDYLDPDDCGFSIPEGFSPNGDGINDVFVIHGLSMYPGSKLSIFNRWGNVVYETDNYQNNWNGEMSEGSGVGNSILPIGTYFYVLNLGGAYQPKSGYVYLNR
jgi:gliding motility-associated-like protein/uncharacterized repeat protein (TIGR01451 family)